jgi:hypothetical protein
MSDGHLQTTDERLVADLNKVADDPELSPAEQDTISHAAERLENLSDEIDAGSEDDDRHGGDDDGDDDSELGAGLERAHNLVTADRNDTHGDAYENHKQIADLWTAYLQYKLPEGVEIKAHEAAIMVQHIKQSRMQAGRPIGDHFDDIAGYSEVAKYSAVQDDTVDIELEE